MSVFLNSETVNESSPPTGWRLTKIKYLANYVNGYAFKPDQWGNTGKPIIRIQNLTDSGAEPNRFDGEIDTAYKVVFGDLLISWSASLGLYVWKGGDAWLNQHIFRVDLNEALCARNFFKWLATWFMAELAKDAHGSTMQHLTKDAFGSFPVLLPCLNEQRLISDFLDAEITKLDELINEKKALIDLLTEKKQAMISQSVTRGLDSNAPRKESEIEWLGEIPAHWEVERAKPFFLEVDDRSTTGEEILFSLRMEVGLVPHDKVSDKPLTCNELIGYKKAKKGQLVINRMRAASGLIAVMPDDGLVSPDYAVFQASEAICQEYFLELFKTQLLQAVFRSESKGLGTGSSGFLRLYSDSFLSIKLPIPPINEQVGIILHIRLLSEGINNLVIEAKNTIKLLQERRTALIAAAVTGQLDMKMGEQHVAAL
jgi:type I restriction enzyme S subunit